MAASKAGQVLRDVAVDARKAMPGRLRDMAASKAGKVSRDVRVSHFSSICEYGLSYRYGWTFHAAVAVDETVVGAVVYIAGNVNVDDAVAVVNGQATIYRQQGAPTLWACVWAHGSYIWLL